MTTYHHPGPPPTAGASALLGEVVCWDLRAVEVPLDAVETALRDAGLPTAAVSDLRPTTAFSRAVADLKANRTIDRIKPQDGGAPRADDGLIRFQFTRKELEASGLRLDFSYETVCTLDPSDGEITCPDEDIQDHARRMFAHATTHRNTSDITRTIQRLFRDHADLFPISPKGVAYFVPDEHRAFTAAIEQFLRAVGGQLLRFPVPKGTPEGNRSVKESVEAGLEAMRHDLDMTLADWDAKTRAGTMDKAVAEWRTIQHKALAYSEYLGERQQGLLDHLNATKKRLAAKIADVDAAKAAAKGKATEGQMSFIEPVIDPQDSADGAAARVTAADTTATATID